MTRVSQHSNQQYTATHFERQGPQPCSVQATPPQVIPGAIIAERNHIPFVTGVAPIRAFLGAQPKWKYAWIFSLMNLHDTTAILDHEYRQLK